MNGKEVKWENYNSMKTEPAFYDAMDLPETFDPWLFPIDDVQVIAVH